MYGTQLPLAELYQSLLQYPGDDAYTHVLEPWVNHHPEECDWFKAFRDRTDSHWDQADDKDLCRLYALFRVTSILLLRFQDGRAGEMDYPGPAISEEGFVQFHEPFGFRTENVADFHPFFHEIIKVIDDQTADPEPKILDQRWPCLMLGHLMFCRAGCAISAGSPRVIKEIAESSTLYWTFRRKDRPCQDQSYGWGQNSQWRTRHRRDYHSNGRFYFNVDGKLSLNDPDCEVEDVTREQMIELVRNRGMVRSQVDDSDLYPYVFRYIEEKST